jgi:hypothetical protein
LQALQIGAGVTQFVRQHGQNPFLAAVGSNMLAAYCRKS